ncbi:MAG: cyclic nucleotide-binding domain-containing protein [Magnetococcales bacterium]|nr:cyclic nucleotide-binding domain-containing protein [Magnetococcales bacterium]
MTRKAFMGQLGEKEWEALAQTGSPLHVHGGEVIFEEGEEDEHIYVVLKGKVALGRTKAKHQWLTMGPYGEVDMAADDPGAAWKDHITLGRGSLLGEMDFHLPASHTLSAQAVEESDLVELSPRQMAQLKQTYPQIYRRLAMVMTAPAQ